MSEKLEIESELSLPQAVERSLSTVRKKGKKQGSTRQADMAEHPPALLATDTKSLEVWAAELLKQVWPKPLEEMKALFADASTVLYSIGTHAFKLPNADVDTRPIFADFPLEPLPAGLLHERLLPKHYVYSGNSQNIQAGKFLLAKIRLDGKETNVFEQLTLGFENSVVKALLKAGLPLEVCVKVKQLSEEKPHSFESVPVHPLTKQVYFEAEGEEDVLLVPVASEAMIVEFQHQAMFPKNTGRWLALRRVCAVGGANPVNGGALCSDFGGAFQILEAVPPQMQDMNLARRIKRGAAVYIRSSIANSDVLTFVSSSHLTGKTGNAKDRDAEQALYSWFAQILGGPLIQADSLAAAGLEITGEAGAIGDYLRRDRFACTQEELALAAVLEIVKKICQQHERLRNHLADSCVRDNLIEKMKEALL